MRVNAKFWIFGEELRTNAGCVAAPGMAWVVVPFCPDAPNLAESRGIVKRSAIRFVACQIPSGADPALNFSRRRRGPVAKVEVTERRAATRVSPLGPGLRRGEANGEGLTGKG